MNRTSSSRSQRFRAEREGDWRRLEGLLTRAESRSAASLSDDELLALPVLYRAGAVVALGGAGDLARPQPDRLSREPVHPRLFLRLRRARRAAAAARAVLRTRLADRGAGALARDAGLVRDHRGRRRRRLPARAPTTRAGSAAWCRAGCPAAATRPRPPPSSSTPSTTPAARPRWRCWRPTFSATTPRSPSSLSRSASPSACRPPSCLAENGLTLGAFFALFVSRGLGFQLGGWLFIHGVTELFAIMLGGAAGFRIGWRVAFPGDRDPARRRGRGRPLGRAGDRRGGADADRGRACWKASRAS